MLPEPYRWLLSSPSSPIAEYYPKTFTVDMNGKRWPWEAVVLLPFIDTQELLKYSRRIPKDMLSADEIERNKKGRAIVMSHDSVQAGGKADTDAVRINPFESSDWNSISEGPIAFQPEVNSETVVPLPGFPTLSSAPIRSLWRRRLGIDVFGLKSRYKTACLEHSAALPTLPPLEALGHSLIGSTIWINYPHLTEAFVTAVSNESQCIRGKDGKPKRWSKKKAMDWTARRASLIGEYKMGQGFSGTGGLILSEHQEVLLSVRPFQGLRTLPGGTTAKAFSKFELEVPIMATLWAPHQTDHRLSNVPALLEKDPYKYADAPPALPVNSGAMLKKKDNSVSKGKGGKGGKGKNIPTLKDEGSLKTNAPASPEVENVSGEKTHWASPYDDFASLAASSQSHGSDNALKGSSENIPFNGSKTKAKINGQSSRMKDSAKVMLDILPRIPSHDDAWLPLDQEGGEKPLKKIEMGTQDSGSAPASNTSVRDSTVSLPDEMKVVKATNSKWWWQSTSSVSNPRRDFSTRPMQKTPSVRPRTVGNSQNLHIRVIRPAAPGTPRARLVAVGIAMTVFVFGSGAHAYVPGDDLGRVPHLKRVLSSLVDLRGGSGGDSYLYGINGDGNRKVDDGAHSSPPALEFAHGTTTLSFVFQGGAIVAVDSRASLGNFVGSKTVQKVLPINS
jgi:hypothetical protein